MRRFQDYVLDREGNAVAGAEVYVRKQSDSTLATIYSDNGVTTKANPTTTDNDGEWFYYAADDTYKFQVYVDGVQQNEVTHVQHYDLSVITTAAWSVLDDASVGDIRTTLGVGTGDSPQFTAINLGHATDTTITRVSAGVAAVEGSNILLASNISTASEYRNDTASKLLQGAIVWDAAESVALTPGATVALDLDSGINFTLAMGGDYELSTPTNAKPGQSGCIEVTQDGTGTRLLTYASGYVFAGGSNPVLSTAPSSLDLLFYQVLSNGDVFIAERGAVAA
jgi:hypothetical protein